MAEHNYVNSAAFSADGKMVAAELRVWDVASGKVLATFRDQQAANDFMASAIPIFPTPNGKLLASCSGGSQTINDQTVRVWDLTTGREQRRFEGHRGTVNAVVFTPDGRSIVSGSEDATALVWDVSDLKDYSKTDDPLTPESLQARWDELAGNNARAAYRAAWALRVPSAVTFLLDHLKVATMTETVTSPEVLRSVRAITVLEHVHTPVARAVIERLTQGAPDAIMTREAKATLERLNRAMGR